MAVFLDLQMPDVGGFEALKLIMQYNAENPKNLEVPVIIYSSYSDQAVIQRCLDAGAFAFLQKPVDLNELKNLLLLIQP